LAAASQWRKEAENEDELRTRSLWLAVTQSSLAALLKNRGQYDEAERLYRASLAVFEEIGDRREVAVTQSSLADLLQNRGQYDEAERLYQSGLAICHEVRDLQGIGVFLMGLGQLRLAHGQRDEAAAMFREAQQRFLAIGLPNWADQAEQLLRQTQA
jgi:tetratricopeptide (TPR) repeat protein